MNFDMLKGVVRMHGDTQEDLAAAIGISLSNLNAKMNGKTACFRQNEILAIKDRYRLTAKEVDQIFFENNLS